MGRIRLPTVALLIAAAAFITYGGSAAPPMPDFVPGQMWSVKSSAPTTAKVIVARVEPWNGKTVVHVSIVDISVPPGTSEDLTSIDFVPFERSALAGSVDRLLETGVSPLPHFENNHERWRTLKGAGVFEVGVPEAIRILLRSAVHRRI